jgi:hypothetical protein
MNAAASRSIFFALSTLLCAPVFADDREQAASDDVDPSSSTPRSFGSQLLYDTGYVFTAPARWDTTDWMHAGLVAAVIGTSALFDKRESDPGGDSSNNLDNLAKKLEPFGERYSLATLLGFYGIGKLTDSPREIAVGEDGLTASIVSALVTSTLKVTVGRARPSQTADKTDFHPFQGDQSFPSGHTTEAFAVASVISAHYDSPWVDTAAYSVATLVGYARHEHNMHWTSDIVAGAVIGYAVGHTVVKLNDENRSHISIGYGESGPMLQLTIPFK